MDIERYNEMVEFTNFCNYVAHFGVREFDIFYNRMLKVLKGFIVKEVVSTAILLKDRKWVCYLILVKTKYGNMLFKFYGYTGSELRFNYSVINGRVEGVVDNIVDEKIENGYIWISEFDNFLKSSISRFAVGGAA